MPYMSLREQRHLLRRYLKQYRLERTPAHRQAVQDTLLHLDPMHPAAPIMRLRYARVPQLAGDGTANLLLPQQSL
ncbi:MAG: hypothetical protein ACLTGJ_02320 [Faecalibacterium prausnitzii]